MKFKNQMESRFGNTDTMVREYEMNKICEYGLSTAFLKQSKLSVFVSYDWIDEDESDLLDGFFSGQKVNVLTFGDGPWPQEVNVGESIYDEAIIEISKGIYGDFILEDGNDRYLVISNARNLYVFVGPRKEVRSMIQIIPEASGIENLYQQGYGDLAENFHKTRRIYEHYRPFYLSNFLE